MNTDLLEFMNLIESRIRRPLSRVELERIESENYLGDVAATGDPERVAAECIEAMGVRTRERTSRIRVVSTEREHLLARLSAEAAKQNIFVVGFRSRFLGGEVLPFHELPEWLQQQQLNTTPGRTWSALELPPGVKFQRQDGHWTLAKRVPFNAAVHRRVTRTLRLTDPEEPRGEPLRVDIDGMGALHVLDELSVRLADTFRWTQPDAATFVLTDHVPTVVRMRGVTAVNLQAPSLSTIEMSIDPDCTSQEVAAFFAQLKGGMGSSGRGVARSAKAVRLMKFALGKPSVSYEQLRRLWNEEVGESDAYGDRSAIRLALKRAKKLILEPSYSELQSNLLADAWRTLAER